MQTVQNICSVIGGREEQQDGYTFIQDNKNGNLLCIVADGAGGHQGGSTASKIAIDTADEVFYSITSREDEGIENDLIDYCNLVHDKINSLSEEKIESPRTTIAGVFIKKSKAYLFNIGDSRVYKISDRKIVTRTKDHSVVQFLLDQGEITENEMGTHPDQSKLLKALGGEVFFAPSIKTLDVEEGDGFLVCTDGFWERITTAEIETLFSRLITPEKIDRAVKTAVSRNGIRSDNTTVCTIQIGEPRKNYTRIFVLLFIAFIVLTSIIVASKPINNYVIKHFNISKKS